MDQKENEQAADLYVRAAELFEADPDHTDETVIMDLEIQAARIMADSEVHRYDEAMTLLDRAAQRETLPSEKTFLLRLRTAYEYGTWLTGQASATEDPVQRAAFEQNSRDQFGKGIDIGNALVQNFPSSALGYYYLALCQIELGDSTAAEINLQQYNQLSQPEIQ